jgi:DNA-binding protein H-NS
MNSYVQMVAQIEELKKQAEKTRKEEFSTVVKAIKKQLRDYGITASDLGLDSKAKVEREGKRSGTKGSSRSRTKRAKASIKVAPKYRDESGNTWTGRGKQPKWLVAALSAGRSLESLLIR